MKGRNHTILLSLALLGSLPGGTATAQVDVLTQRGDSARSSNYLNETTLTPANVQVGKFRKLYFREVDGNLYAQPLYVSQITILSKPRNMIYVATEGNTVYAFEDDPAATAPLWQVSLGAPIQSTELSINLGKKDCFDLTSTIGITSTPVIDKAANTIYVVSKTKQNGKYAQTIHALDLATGKSLRHAEIAGEAAGNGKDSKNGKIVFDPLRHLNRPGLLLDHGALYIAFASHCDADPFHGWLFAYDAGTLTQRGILLTAPDGSATVSGEAGIWQSGHGLAADGDGNVYFITGNGIYTNDGRNLGDSFVKVKLTNIGLKVVGWYAPPNQDLLRRIDVDLGSAGPLLISGTNLIIGGGKEGKLHVLDRTAMTGRVVKPVQPEFVATLNPLPLVPSPNKPGDIQYWNIHGSPVHYEGPTDRFIYLCGEEEPIKAFRLARTTTPAGWKIDPTTPFARSNERPGHPGIRDEYPPNTQDPRSKAADTWMPGGFIAISANGTRSNTAILWALMPWNKNANRQVVPGVLRAFDATSFLTRPGGPKQIKQIWSSDHDNNSSNDSLGMYAKFVYPIVANGRVIVPAFNEEDNNHQPVPNGNKAAIVVYGL